MSSTCPHNMANFGRLTAEICWRVWGTPANFNGFRVLPSLLQRRRSPKAKANQTSHDVWPSPGLLHHIYIFGGSCRWQNFARCKIHFMFKSCVLVYWQRYRTALQHQTSAKFCGVVQGMELQNFRRGRHLYSARRPSRWASAHILVFLSRGTSPATAMTVSTQPGVHGITGVYACVLCSRQSINSLVSRDSEWVSK